MERLIFIYSANSGIMRNIPGALAKMAGGKSSCALCTITHGPIFEKPSWKTFVESLDIPATFFHRDEVPVALQEFVNKENMVLPVVLKEESDGSLKQIMSKEQLESYSGEVECVKKYFLKTESYA
ncbi:hypothetical protein HY620_00215 [Candidatus Uhrbacteria bacterium]|nr:hypothetical protein [Candidatus Uhrbacteria bacterium]